MDALNSGPGCVNMSVNDPAWDFSTPPVPKCYSYTTGTYTKFGK